MHRNKIAELYAARAVFTSFFNQFKRIGDSSSYFFIRYVPTIKLRKFAADHVARRDFALRLTKLEEF
ncbi:hypothetical protein NEOLI_004969 [Neolecta irregularis DAH-3]|uniref:Uncharacterized protein n=1 Tax=Neolecta irregularis (strain DAH-3) TaxID=1198029 RepID=A0A1U7LLA6_NEOID|nr:hypothetical protein NEOLI_004969 [Neolecta irregularis DAH-3]|eukprot:OLL23446.1 hypothetical protein NEOLI_004969 [Neolecta irregularis DAH-3]